MKGLHGLLVPLLFLPLNPAVAQPKGHIQGRVVDAQTKQPLIGAHVLIMGTTMGAATDAEGVYRIMHVREEVYKLKVTYLGYVDYIETDVVVVRGKTTYINEIELASLPVKGGTVTVTPDAATAPVSSQMLQREEIRRKPGTAGDVLRSLGALPGVSTSEGEFSALSVRGGGVYDNLILIDNIPFEKINHFEGGSSEQETQGGRFSVFTAGLIERATFHGGGFGAEYGGKNASVLDLRVKEGNMESPTVNGSYGLLGLEVNYDGPTYLLGNTSLVLNVRDFDMKRALELANEEDFGDPSMADVIAKTTTYINANSKISILGIYSADRLVRAASNIIEGEDLVENDVWDIDETRWLLGVNWRLLPSKTSVLQNTFFYRSNDRFRSAGYVWADGIHGQLPSVANALSVRDRVAVQNEEEAEIGWKSDFHYAVGSNTWNAGLEIYTIDLAYDFTQNGVDTLYQFTASDLQAHPDQKYLVVRPEDVNYRFDGATTHMAVYTSYDFRLGNWRLTPGVRYAYNGFSKDHQMSPRLQVRYPLTSQTTLNVATGIYYQKPLNKQVVTAAANRELKDERAMHIIVGLRHMLRPDLQLTLESYYKRRDQLITRPTTGQQQFTNEGEGWASGFDAMLYKRFTNRYYGHITYSYATSKRNDDDGWGSYNTPYTQPHNFTAMAAFQINSKWFVSARWKYGVGRPKDRFIVHEDVLDNREVLRFSKEITARNADRVADFHMLTVRVDYRKQIGRLGLITFVELDNIYDRFNTYEDRFSELTGKEKGLGFGFAGNAGFKVEF